MAAKRVKSVASELKLMRTLWGVINPALEESKQPQVWEKAFARIAGEGYAGIEACVNTPLNIFLGQESTAKDLLKKYNLAMIGQIHTSGYPVASRKVEEHLASLEEQLVLAKKMDCIFVNSHSGSDSWSLEQSLQFFRAAEQLAEKHQIKLVHETHRQRILYNPWVTRDVLQALPTLKVNADLSHFCVVAERVFSAALDPEWPGILQQIAHSCHLIHARVGYAEGPQVPHPAAPEYRAELEAHMQWWETLWTAINARGDKQLYVEPEHGPAPYQHSLPYTGCEVADVWQVNSWVGKHVAQRYAEWQKE
eukprot:m.9731 g.9731  ORF g.9731 m.9731 type:complete len:308 (-) comp5631_c1_seq1:51-974(-)